MAITISYKSQPHKIDYQGNDPAVRTLFSALDQMIKELYDNTRTLANAAASTASVAAATSSVSKTSGSSVVPFWMGDDAAAEDQIWLPPCVPSVIAQNSYQLPVSTTGAITDLNLGGASLVVMNNASLATIKGIVAGYPGQIVTFVSNGAGQVDFTHQDAGEATASNRLINTVTSLNTSLAPGKGVASYQYDAATLRWRLIQHIQGAFIAYTPVWHNFGGDPTIGNGTIIGEYLIRGSNIVVFAEVDMGSTTTFGTGSFFYVTIPAAPASPIRGLGPATVYDNDGAGTQAATAVYTNAGSTGLIPATSAGSATPTVPFTWAVSDFFAMWAEYQIT